jgi:hypothetical protein
LRFHNISTMYGDRERIGELLPTKYAIRSPASTTSLGEKASINAAPMIPIKKRTTAPRAVKLILVIFGILGASAAHAQNAPWCLQSSGEGSLHCTYATFQQCLADRKGNGFCIQNSTYQASTPSIRRR